MLQHRTVTHRAFDRIGRAAVALIAAALSAAPVQAQWKPDRPVDVVVGFASGGGNDKSAEPRTTGRGFGCKVAGSRNPGHE